MRILACAFKTVGLLLFSHAARRLVVFTGGGKPYLEIHSLHTAEPPRTMDKCPPRPRWIVGYSDASDSLRMVPAPGGHARVWNGAYTILFPLSADGTPRAVARIR